MLAVKTLGATMRFFPSMLAKETTSSLQAFHFIDGSKQDKVYQKNNHPHFNLHITTIKKHQIK